MGTSGSFGGAKGGTPLVPSWVDPSASSPSAAPAPASAANNSSQPNQSPNPSQTQIKPNPDAENPSLQQIAPSNRFTGPRTSFSKFARSGGTDRGTMGKAVSAYVSKATGGSRTATQRMGSSRGASARLVGFLSDVQARGPVEALRTLNLEGLAGRPIEEIFLGLTDYICPAGGSVDEGIAREAFIETIAALADQGITDLNTFNAEQTQTVFEMFASYAIEARICNDIGNSGVKLPSDIQAIERVQSQLVDFIRRAVSDALASAKSQNANLTQDRVQEYVEGVYEAAFDVLKALGDAEVEK